MLSTPTNWNKIFQAREKHLKTKEQKRLVRIKILMNKYAIKNSTCHCEFLHYIHFG